MITGVHAMFYSTDPEATRAFLRDTLQLPAHDVGDGWLIFDVPEGEVGCHPADEPRHGVSFYTNDIDATIETLRSKGVPIKKEIEDAGWGRVAAIEMPGGVEVEIYQPRYTKG
jgi:catechol 2,3-dioxygenase-like lactoylglutathione lyase family enzyme